MPDHRPPNPADIAAAVKRHPAGQAMNPAPGPKVGDRVSGYSGPALGRLTGTLVADEHIENHGRAALLVDGEATPHAVDRRTLRLARPVLEAQGGTSTVVGGPDLSVLTPDVTRDETSRGGSTLDGAGSCAPGGAQGAGRGADDHAADVDLQAEFVSALIRATADTTDVHLAAARMIKAGWRPGTELLSREDRAGFAAVSGYELGQADARRELATAAPVPSAGGDPEVDVYFRDCGVSVLLGESIAEDQGEYALTPFVAASEVHTVIAAYLKAHGIARPGSTAVGGDPETGSDAERLGQVVHDALCKCVGAPTGLTIRGRDVQLAAEAILAAGWRPPAGDTAPADVRDPDWDNAVEWLLNTGAVPNDVMAHFDHLSRNEPCDCEEVR